MNVPMQLFFVYDLTYCKKESDDPKDAIIYFHPPQVSENKRCIICCQLVGMVQFFQSTFSCPKIIVLQKGKFAVKVCDNYLLALEAKSGVPDNIVWRQLNHLYNTFCFYHKSISRVYKLCKRRQDFVKRMEIIMNCCLPVSCCFGNDVLLAFDALPVFLVPEVKYSSIYLEAIKLLRNCQKHSGIIAGCILFDNQILVTQLNSVVTRYVLLVKFIHELFSPEEIQVPFQLPSGIEIVKVFIKRKMLERINKVSKYYAKMTNKLQGGGSNTYASDVDVSSGSEGDVDSDASVENAWEVKFVSKRKDESDVKSEQLESSDDAEDCLKSDKGGDIWRSISDSDDEKSNVCKIFMKKYGILHYPSSSSISYDQIDTLISQDYNLNDDYKNNDEIQEMRLFIQYYMNSVMVLLVNWYAVQNIELIQSVWNTALPVLSDLEVALQCHVKNKQKVKTKNDSFLYLQQQERILNGCPIPNSSINDSPLLKSLQRIHLDFEKNTHLSDVSTIVCDKMIHACRSSIHEVYYLRPYEEHSVFSLGYLPDEAIDKLENKLTEFLP
ncbi:uncharacterized protein LOC111618211 [Centruroides sculpturatus]|uniref:uncharacterized protein LOC111618211 n=1 Tax=Centruroides sculpturatus TaxID=218467 RepID=UPI000C6EDE86|nr:uncharacterized protein LOC111618211 [Centruroides sculpturatus]